MLLIAWKNPQASDNFLLRFCNDEFEEHCGYINSTGDTIVPVDLYMLCITDTIITFGIVIDNENRFIAIDVNGDFLFEVFNFDNGPDYISEGTFRITKEGKIGFADSTGKIIIEPRFSCAHPFENGYAKVSLECDKKPEGEYSRWESNEWFYVDKHGNRTE